MPSDAIQPLEQKSKPLRSLAVLTLVLAGGFAGLSLFTFGYAEGGSYLSNDSASCANCHVMQEHYDAWIKSSHGKVANCNDCHAPDDMGGKYYCKARNGFFHSWAFTTGQFPDRILMHDYNRQVVEQNCRNCHSDFVHTMTDLENAESAQTSCLHCHSTVGHDTGG